MTQSFESFFKSIIPALKLQLDASSWNEPFIVERCIIRSCQQDNLVILEQLLEYDPKLATTVNNQFSLLMCATSVGAVRLIIDKAQEKNCLHQLLLIKTQDKLSVFDVFCLQQRFDLLEELMQVSNFHDYTDIPLLLNRMRGKYFKSLNKHQLIDRLCIRLREFKNERCPPHLLPGFHKQSVPIDFVTAARWLNMPVTFSFGPKDSKTSAIQHAIIQLFSLLSTPTECVKYLQLINWELMRYHQEKYDTAFPQLDEHNWSFQTINGITYPIPTSDYIGIKKHSALQECLVAILNARGLAKKAYKWIGFIPNEIADDMVRRGDLFLECRFGSGLFHTKTAHALQIVMLIYAIESGRIQLDYDEGTEIKQISVLDILDVLVTEKTEINHNSFKLWSIVLDSVKTTCVFTDPFQLGSLVMFYGKEWQIQALSDALIDTFCKGYLRLLLALNTNNPALLLTHDSLVTLLNDLKVEQFSALSLYEYSVQREEARTPKTNFFAELEDKRHAIVEKKYDITPSFQPLQLRPFYLNIHNRTEWVMYRSLYLNASRFNDRDWCDYIRYVLLEASAGNNALFGMVRTGLMAKQYTPPVDSPLFCELKIMFNATNGDGLTALQEAIILKNKDIICYLLTLGVNYTVPFQPSTDFKSLLSVKEATRLMDLFCQGTERAMLSVLLAYSSDKSVNMYQSGLKNASGQHTFWCNHNQNVATKMDGYGLKSPSGDRHLFWSNCTQSRARHWRGDESSYVKNISIK